MLKIGVREGSIKKDEKKMVEEIFEFDDTKAIEIYTPYNKIIENGLNRLNFNKRRDYKNSVWVVN